MPETWVNTSILPQKYCAFCQAPAGFLRSIHLARFTRVLVCPFKDRVPFFWKPHGLFIFILRSEVIPAIPLGPKTGRLIFVYRRAQNALQEPACSGSSSTFSFQDGQQVHLTSYLVTIIDKLVST